MSTEKRPYTGALVRPIPFPLDHLPPKQRARFLLANVVEEERRTYRSLAEAISDVATDTDEEIARSVEARLRTQLRLQREQKLFELARFFCLEPNKKKSEWKELALQLAIRHVSGFRTCLSSGAPKTGKLKDNLIGTAILWKLKGNPGKSVTWASENIKKQFPGIKGKPKGIERAYYRWRKTAVGKRWIEMAESRPEEFEVWVEGLRKMGGVAF